MYKHNPTKDISSMVGKGLLDLCFATILDISFFKITIFYYSVLFPIIQTHGIHIKIKCCNLVKITTSKFLYVSL